MSRRIASRQNDRAPEAGEGGPIALAWRGSALVMCAVVAAGLFYVYAGPSFLLAIYRVVVDGGLAVAWAGSAAGLGWGLWRAVWRRSEASERICPALVFSTCLAVGIGVLSLAIMAFGLEGWLNRASAYGLLTPGWIGDLLFLVIHRNRWEAGPWLRQRATWEWLWAPLMPLLAIVLIAATFPPGILWGDEPNGYDVVEYHLQVPREWFEGGRIVGLHHNVFSYFPFNVEMHYLLAMHLRGGPWAGMYMAQFMHVILCLAVVVAVFGIAGGGRRGTVAATLAAAPAWLALLAPLAYNEGGMLLFGTLAIGWVMRGENWRQFALAGAMAGFAAGAKLTAAAMVILAVPVAMGAAYLICAAVSRVGTDPHPNPPPEYQGRGKLGAVVFVFAAMIVLSPWLARNFVWTHNPVFPEMTGIFGKAHFSHVQADRWERAYRPDAEHQSFRGHLAALSGQIVLDWRYGYILLPLAVIATVLGRRKQQTIFLAMMLLIMALIWLLFTHLQSRFFVLGIPIAALLAGQIDRPVWLGFCGAAAVAMTLLSIESMNQKIETYIEIDRRSVDDSGLLIGKENLQILTPEFNRAQLRPGTTLVLVGEARAFLYQIPMSRLFYKTVFDVDTTDPRRTVIEDWLSGMQATDYRILPPDLRELARFHQTYGTPAPPLSPSTGKSPYRQPGSE